jgi:predicted transcriptional regulator
MESVERAKQLGATLLGSKFDGPYYPNEVRQEAQEMKQYTSEAYRKFKIQIIHLIQVQAKRLLEEAQKLNIPVKLAYLNMIVATALLTGCYPAVTKGITGLKTCFKERGLSNQRVEELGQWVRDMGFLEIESVKTTEAKDMMTDKLEKKESPLKLSRNPEQVDKIENRFFIVKKLGEGTFGAVYLAEDKKTKQRVALKQLFPDRFDLEDVQEEIDLLNYIQANYPQHTCPPFLACYVGFFVDQKRHYYLTMEYAPGINLQAYLLELVTLMKTQPQYAKPVVQQIKVVLKQVLQHLSVLEQMGVTQLDFNAGNVLVRKDQKGVPHVTLIDYGALCSNTKNRACTMKMPCTYCAPEQVAPRRTAPGPMKKLGNIQKAPVFALGALLYEVLQGSNLWSVDRRKERDRTIQLMSTGMLYGKEPYAWRAPKFLWPYDVQITNMVNDMLIADPQKRPSASTLARLLS